MEGDDNHNNSLITKKKINTYVSEFADTPITASPGTDGQLIDLDTAEYRITDHADFTNWVGFGDSFDAARISPAAPAHLNFTLNGMIDDGTVAGSLKITVYKVTAVSGGWKQTKLKEKTLNLKSKDSVSTGVLKLDRLDVPPADETGVTGYYVTVQSTNAKKGGEGYYNVVVTGDVFTDADVSLTNKSGNGWLYDKSGKSPNNGLETNEIAGTKDDPTAITLDKAGSVTGGDNFIGFGDEYDYAELINIKAGTYTFSLTTEAAKTKFTVYSLTKSGSGWKQKTLGSVTNKIAVTGVTKDINFKEDSSETTRYFVSMQATDTKNSPMVYYSVSAWISTASNGSALSMPETDSLAMPKTSDALAMTDVLSLGGYDTDVLADASASALADLDDKSGWLNIASLA